MQSSRVVTPGDLDRPIRTALPSLARGAAGLARLGITTPREALWYLPFRYDDFSELRTLRELVPDEKQSARVTVDAVRVEPGFRRRPQRVIAQLSDAEGGSAEAIWFGRRFVERRLQAGDEVIVSGKVTERGWRRQFTSPEFSPVGRDSVHTARVVPVYHLSGSMTQKRLRELLARILEATLPSLEDPLTDAERGDLPPLAEALQTAHFPETEAETAPALDRLAFDELLALQLGLAQARKARDDLQAPAIRVADADLAEIIGALPFTLTGDQSGGRRGDHRGPRLRAADAPPAPGRRRQRQDRGGGGRAGIGGAGRLAGRADGADRDPGAAAPRRAGAAAGSARRAVRVPLRLADGEAQARDPRRDRRRHGRGRDRHARGDQRGRRVSAARAGDRRRAASVRGRPARRAPGQGRRRRAAHARADRDADSADARADRLRRPLDQHDPRDAARPPADPHRDPRPAGAAEDRGLPGVGGGRGTAVVRGRAARRRVGVARGGQRRGRGGAAPGGAARTCASRSSTASSAPTSATRR